MQLARLCKKFITDEVETTALDDIDLAIAPGEFVAVTGPSGCGKSTLLNILGAIDTPSSGSYLYNGVDIASLGQAALARFRATELGFVFQSFNLIDELTIGENVELGLAYHGSDARKRRAMAEAAMHRVGIAHRARHFPHQLSGGQQQRAAIARAIVREPKLILADEPTGNLDSANGAQVMNILAGLHEAGATIVMVTHSPDQAGLADRRIEMLDGRITSASASPGAAAA